MILNIEGDEIAYRCAFTGQEQRYIMHLANNRKYKFNTKLTKTEIVKYMKSKGKDINKDYDLESYLLLSEPYVVLGRVDAYMKELYSLTAFYDKDIKVTEMKVWLSPSDQSNFRYSVVKTKGPNGLGYKAGRPAKPYYLQLAKDRLKKKWEAIEIKGYEADDALGIYNISDDCISVHIDKDINMIPGWHYHHVNKEWFYAQEFGELRLEEKKLKGSGILWFYAQLLLGDRTDNIPGIPGFGDVKTFKNLEGITNEYHALAKVYNIYQLHYKEQSYDILKEIASLVYICRNTKEHGGQYIERKFNELGVTR